MKFVRETHSSLTIHQVDEGVIRIGDEKIRENVVLFRDTIERGWMVDDVSKLVESDFATLIEKSPEIVIFGTGWTPKLPPRDLVFALARRGIGFETMDTPAACRTFNVLISEDRDVAAVLLINSTDP
ncbi:MAG: MTH938/NDUFAF3 family protein [Woeseiaceae bacterium]|mgnify:CR=1 FL=1|jgi:uncharacterized protein|nr:MTH938/NDUFAF3 family protein [Woeseiaceae bacterium]|tara:strand:+ start:673 stop:1053 length:381 start_codon:yes stop_codon:yes gene_type:complete